MEDGPPSFPRDSTCPAVLGNCFQRDRRVSCTGLSPPLVVLSRIIPLHADFLTLRVNPEAAPQPQRYSYRWFRLFPVRSPLLRESHLISLPEGTEMFHFPSFPPHCLCVQQWVTAHDDCRVSPFGNPRIKAWLTTPRGLSWPPTSFIGSWCQGIHRAPLKTWPQMLASTVQFSNNDQPPVTHHQRGASPGPASKAAIRPYLQTPNSVPDTLR